MIDFITFAFQKSTTMQQHYHSNAKTNSHIRNEIRNSTESIKSLSARFQVSEVTIRKWMSRESLIDRSSAPKRIKYALNPLQQSLIVSLRTTALLGLDDIWDMMYEMDSSVSRASVYRTLKSEGINKQSKEQKAKCKKFKEYIPGYIHMDVTYLPKLDNTKYYLFVAIDRATRLMYYNVYDAKTSSNTELFMKECLVFFPFKITHVLTDNGLEFTNKLIKSKNGKTKAKDSKLDIICKSESIDHRTTKPFTPQTNGMVERVNGTIKSATILKETYSNIQEMQDALSNFLWTYNLFRRHGGLRKELNVKTPYEAVTKWHEIDPSIFVFSPEELLEKINSFRKE